MSEKTRLEFYASDRGEEKNFQVLQNDQEFIFPVTRMGFEALVKLMCVVYDFPINDDARYFLCSFIHSLDRRAHTATIKEIADAYRKHATNGLTYTIIEEINKKLKAERDQEQASKTPTLVPHTIELPASDETSA